MVGDTEPSLLSPEGYPVVPTLFSEQSILFSLVSDATLTI